MTGEYIISDARNLPTHLPRPAAVAVVDLAWARPNRNGVGICYDTHAPNNGLWQFVDAVHDALEAGGWAFFDADSWLLPRLTDYLREEWGDVAATYRGGGYRRTGWVVDDGGRGHYFTNGGYPVVFAHKGETDRTASVAASQHADGPPHDVRRGVEWESIKPIAPYEMWLGAVTRPDDLVAVPCAGTAPAALAAERLGLDWVAVDNERDARRAFEQRRTMQLEDRPDDQPAVTEFA